MAITVYTQVTHPDRFTLRPLQHRVVSVIGYGNQGRAQALCLRDSGIRCVAGVRSGSRSESMAHSDAMPVEPIDRAAMKGDLVIIALPDEVHGEVVDGTIVPAMREGATLGFLHGFSVRFGLVKPPPGMGVVLLAPKGPGITLRELYLQGHGLPALFANHQDSSAGDAEAMAFAWATAIGAGRSGVIATSFADEAETDLFGEQAVLCGGMLALMLAAFETLVEAGYEPELAYLECCHELKQVADLLYVGGPAGMAAAISNTAEFGAYRSGPQIVDDAARGRLRSLLESIRAGQFAAAIDADARRGFEWFLAERARLKRHPIEPAGRAIRALMPWLSRNSNQP